VLALAIRPVPPSLEDVFIDLIGRASPPAAGDGGTGALSKPRES
jgi:hypothetical protein